MITGIVDSHAHYDDDRFKADREQVLRSALEAGVEQIVNIGVDVGSSKKSIGLAQQFSFMYATVGIHPLESSNAPSDYYSSIKKLATQPKVVAVGEIGLDYHYEGYDKGQQQKIFDAQLSLAEEVGLPVVIHSREACADTIDILSSHKGTRGVIHCFSGSAETAKRLVAMGYYIGFTGVITYKNARGILEAVEAVPLDRLLVETDCPYLPPVPHRGQRCSSDMLYLTVERMAQIKGQDSQQMADITADNARALFGLQKAL